MGSTNFRLIIQSDDNLTREVVTITEDFDAPVDEFQVAGLTIRYDDEIELSDVDGMRIDEFPYETELHR